MKIYDYLCGMKETLTNIKNLFNGMKKNKKSIDLQKEQYRGTLKQIMKVRGLRTISLKNYSDWKKETPDTGGIHSLKLDVLSGYLNIYGYGTTAKTNKPVCSSTAIEDASAETYHAIYDRVMQILGDEKNIPYRVRKNILVRVAR
jgi:hypothetical protein